MHHDAHPNEELWRWVYNASLYKRHKLGSDSTHRYGSD
jgi:hypothetical protein